MISTKTIRRSRGTAADASWLLTPMFGFSPRTRDRSFHIPPLTRRRPRLVRIPSSSAFPPHLVCDNQLVHRPIDLPAGIDGCCGRIVVDTLSCARLGSALGPTLIRIQRKCIPTVQSNRLIKYSSACTSASQQKSSGIGNIDPWSSDLLFPEVKQSVINHGVFTRMVPFGVTFKRIE